MSDAPRPHAAAPLSPSARPPSPTRAEPAPRSGGAARALDLCVAAPLLVFVAPLVLAIALAIRIEDGGPALLRQPRIGRGARRFACLKFRTLRRGAPPRLGATRPAPSPDRLDRRVTRVGRMVRNAGLDGLPQLINVVRGEMALFGPQPIAPGHMAQYGEAFPRYAATRPGLFASLAAPRASKRNAQDRLTHDIARARAAVRRRADGPRPKN